VSERKSILFFCLLGIFGSAFIFVILGGMDRFRQPVEILLPPRFHGMACLSAVPKFQPGETPPRLRYQTDSDGSVEIDNDLPGGHRRTQFLRVNEDGQTHQQVNDDDWVMVGNEQSPDGRRIFVVYWIGSKLDLDAYLNANRDKHFCSNRTSAYKTS
jgi:hypothetical protein